MVTVETILNDSGNENCKLKIVSCLNSARISLLTELANYYELLYEKMSAFDLMK